MSSNTVSDTMKTVSIARNIKRPTAREFIDQLFDEFMEFHGDRYYADDGAIVGGIASFRGEPVTVIGIQKGHTLEENVACNFGQPNPEGYRKALRLMKQAEKFHRPVITLINTARTAVLVQKNVDRVRRSHGILWKCRVLKRRSSVSLWEKAVAAVHLHLQLEIRCGCWSMVCIRCYHRRALPVYYGEILPESMKLQS